MMRSLRKALSRFSPFPDSRRRPVYDHDGMRLFRKNVGFLNDPEFQRAYRAGMASGHKFGRSSAPDRDIHIEWRVHMALWAARHASRLPGDFVECGVHTGILSLAICTYLDFNNLDKDFWLFDTFAGIPQDQMVQREKELRRNGHGDRYHDCWDIARANFAPYPRAHLVRGKVPDTLGQATIERVAYLSLDMNIAYPESAALEHFWDRLVPGAIVLFDDYAFQGYEEQYRAHSAFAADRKVAIATLPTGQGLLIKP